MGLSVQAQRIRQRRLALQLSQEELAEAIQTVQATISRYERGENDPTAEVLAALARALNTSSDWLLGLSENVNLPVQVQADLNELERTALEALRSSPPAKQDIIVSILQEIVRLSAP